jgi:hypothetical protein
MHGSIVTVCGSIEKPPVYMTLPSSGMPVLYYFLRTVNASGWTALLRVVSYGDAAKLEARVLREKSHLFLEGRFQSRWYAGRMITEIVTIHTTYLDNVNWPDGQPDKHVPPADALQRFGAQAILMGQVMDTPRQDALKGVKGVRFMLKCANPKGHDAQLTIAHYGFMAQRYALSLRPGMTILSKAELRTFYQPVPGNTTGPLLVMLCVTDDIQVLAAPSQTAPAFLAPQEALAR